MRQSPTRAHALWWMLGLACSASAVAKPETRAASKVSKAAHEERSAPPTPPETPSSDHSTRRPKDKPTPPAPPACPDDMVLVEGDYCTEVQQECLKSWYGKANRKTICEVFAEPTECVGERVAKRYCIDRYAFPNVKGERPEVMNTFYQAQVKCAAQGKRMCTESEWTLACEGPEMKPYPYGYERDSTKCNGDRPWDHPNMKKVARRDAKELARLWQGVRSGSQPECVSDFGVYDLPGNNDEVVASENFSSTWRGRYDSVNTGGPWYIGVRNQCRPKIYSHSEGFYYYFLGFRCCSEPDGAPTDPRTPKQRAKDVDFSYVERLAQFTTQEMRETLARKKQGKCECKPKDKLCRTMCGTLLGPNATDAPSRERPPPPLR